MVDHRGRTNPGLLLGDLIDLVVGHLRDAVRTKGPGRAGRAGRGWQGTEHRRVHPLRRTIEPPVSIVGVLGRGIGRAARRGDVERLLPGCRIVVRGNLVADAHRHPVGVALAVHRAPLDQSNLALGIVSGPHGAILERARAVRICRHGSHDPPCGIVTHSRGVRASRQRAIDGQHVADRIVGHGRAGGQRAIAGARASHDRKQIARLAGTARLIGDRSDDLIGSPRAACRGLALRGADQLIHRRTLDDAAAGILVPGRELAIGIASLRTNRAGCGRGRGYRQHAAVGGVVGKVGDPAELIGH